MGGPFNIAKNMLVNSAVIGQNPKVAFASEPSVNGFTKQRFVNFEGDWVKAQDVACSLKGGQTGKSQGTHLDCAREPSDPLPQSFSPSIRR